MSLPPSHCFRNKPLQQNPPYWCSHTTSSVSRSSHTCDFRLMICLQSAVQRVQYQATGDRVKPAAPALTPPSLPPSLSIQHAWRQRGRLRADSCRARDSHRQFELSACSWITWLRHHYSRRFIGNTHRPNFHTKASERAPEGLRL